jgi:hypothetical protein
METKSPSEEITEAKKHLMQSANLMILCIEAVDKVVKPIMEGTMTSDFYQGAVEKLFDEAWQSGFVAKMPTGKLK